MHKLANNCVCIMSDNKYVIRDISGPEYEWARQMGQWPMSYSFAGKNQDFDAPFDF